MSDQDFRPQSIDSAKQHFADAALEEFARLGTKDDEAFLGKIEGTLDEIDYETDLKNANIVEMPRAKRGKVLWMSGAAAVLVVGGLIPILNFLKLETHPANPPQIVASTANIDEDSSLDATLLQRQTQKPNGPQSPYVLTPQSQPADENAEELPQASASRAKKTPAANPAFELAQTDPGEKRSFSRWAPPVAETIPVDISPDTQSNVSLGYDSDYVFKGANPSPAPGQINIDGNTKTKDAIIRRELPLGTGDQLDALARGLSAVPSRNARSESTDHFRSLESLKPIDTTYTNEKDLVTSVSEKPTGSLSFGAGVSTIDTVTGFVEVGDPISFGRDMGSTPNSGTSGNPASTLLKSEQLGAGGYAKTRGFDSLSSQLQEDGKQRKSSLKADVTYDDRDNLFVTQEEKPISSGFQYSGLAGNAAGITPPASDSYGDATTLPIIGGRTATLTPYLGYNGTPDGWVADGSAGKNRNDVLHGGVSLSVAIGGPTPSAAPAEKNPEMLAAVSIPEPAPHAADKVAPAKPAKAPAPKSERYGELIDNPFTSPLKEPLSTFSVDVDTASYSNIRRMVNDNIMVPADSVRIEEMINYFSYDYPQPKDKHPFAFAVETAECPWNADHQLMRVGIQTQSMDRDKRPPANLVFLLDVSGSMSPQNKLSLVKQSMGLLIEELTENDTISIVVYAGAEGLCLPPTNGNQKQKILDSLSKLSSGGSTNGGAGIELAYKIAKENFKEEGVNRVILCTDGDFNVGRIDQSGLVKMVEKKAKDGTFLSVLGFGSGNINDSMLEAITNKGNGNYFYIDTLKEGRKVLLQDLMSTLVTIAKDVKIQIEFNPKHVQHYRLIGYANRMLKAEDFENDKVDAGEIGAGHSVTALYEIVPAGAPPIQRQMSNLKYQEPVEPEQPKMKVVESDELCTLKLRYKLPKSDKSIPMEQPVNYKSSEWKDASDDYQFAAAVALWGMLLRDGEYCGAGTTEDVLEMAKEGRGGDPFGRRDEFIGLVNKWAGSEKLSGQQPATDAMHGGVRLKVDF